MIGLLGASVGISAIGLAALDNSDKPLTSKLFDGLWNAANLVTTLGNFTDFSERQKVFVMATMLAFLTIGGYAISKLSGLLSSDAALALRENRMMESQLDRLANHVIVIGFASLGKLVANKLREAGDTVVVVDRSADLAMQAAELAYLVVQGDAGVDDAALDRAGIGRARAMVVTTEDPDRNLAITLMAHTRNPNLRIAAIGLNRVRSELLLRAGATEVVIADEQIAATLVGHLASFEGDGTRSS
jgi:voltage-gated potassium channel Kch